MAESESRAPDATAVLRVQGGAPLSGRIRPSGNKNEALPVLAATLLANGRGRIENVPRIQDVETLLRVLAGLGIAIEPAERPDALTFDTAGLADRPVPDAVLAARIRGSFLLVPGLLARRGEAVLPRPGGDRIGRRRLDTHLLALRLLGAEIDVRENEYRFRLRGRFRGGDVFLDEASVMATENALMAAATAEGITRISNAASEPHVQGLARYLQGLGVRIEGVGTNLLEVEGRPVEELGPAAHRIGPDHIEVGSFVSLAAMTGGDLRIEGVEPADLRMIRMIFARLGVETGLAPCEGPSARGGGEPAQCLHVPAEQSLEIREDLHGAIPKIDDAPWPGFPADLTSLAVVTATQCRGVVLIHEKMFESRLFFVDRLNAMGAKVVLCDPHRAVVVGPAPLHGEVLNSPDIRAGMALLGAALCAEGESLIRNAHQIDRGYERIDERLRALGARIEREEGA